MISSLRPLHCHLCLPTLSPSPSLSSLPAHPLLPFTVISTCQPTPPLHCRLCLPPSPPLHCHLYLPAHSSPSLSSLPATLSSPSLSSPPTTCPPTPPLHCHLCPPPTHSSPSLSSLPAHPLLPFTVISACHPPTHSSPSLSSLTPHLPVHFSPSLSSAPITRPPTVISARHPPTHFSPSLSSLLATHPPTHSSPSQSSPPTPYPPVPPLTAFTSKAVCCRTCFWRSSSLDCHTWQTSGATWQRSAASWTWSRSCCERRCSRMRCALPRYSRRFVACQPQSWPLDLVFDSIYLKLGCFQSSLPGCGGMGVLFCFCCMNSVPLFSWGCTTGGVYVPCMYSHAGWELLQATWVFFLLCLCDVFWAVSNSLVCKHSGPTSVSDLW